MVVGYEIEDGVAFVTLRRPPVNALGLELRTALLSALQRAATEPAVLALVLCGDGRGFSAGGDLREFGTPRVLAAPRLTLHLHPIIEGFAKPIVAALHGFALGGGLETAMACHYRVACADTRIALPEVGVGVIPLSGTQRLPRLIGMAAALDMIVGARQRQAQEFAIGTLFERLVAPGDIEGLRRAAAALARAAVANGTWPRTRDRGIDITSAQTALDAKRAAMAADADTTEVQRLAVQAIAAVLECIDFDAGMQRANDICEALLAAQPRR